MDREIKENISLLGLMKWFTFLFFFSIRKSLFFCFCWWLRPFGFFPIFKILRKKTRQLPNWLGSLWGRSRQESSLGPFCFIPVHIREKTLKGLDANWLNVQPYPSGQNPTSDAIILLKYCSRQMKTPLTQLEGISSNLKGMFGLHNEVPNFHSLDHGRKRYKKPDLHSDGQQNNAKI